MDPSAQQPPADQQVPQAPPPNPEEQAAAARGDIPMPVQSSQQAVQEAEMQDMSKMAEVANAEKINNETAKKDLENTSGDKDKKEGDQEAGIQPAVAGTSQGKSADQIRVLGEMVEKCEGMPQEFKEEILERIARLAMIRSSAGFLSSTYIIEYESASRFIEWATTFPWLKESEDMLDLAHAKEMMDKNHYGLEPLKERVLEYIASVMLNIKNNGGKDNVIKSPILCLVGLAGTGKTTFAKSLAESLGRQFERIPFGGMADSRVLRGQSRYFPDAEPGAVIKRMIHAGTKNPVILLDELDRVTDTARADIMGVLIEILDPEQNAKFTDHYLDFPVNLQNILFVATANNVSSVATAVLDRLEIVHMPSYNDDEKINIGKNYVLPKAMKVTGLLSEQMMIDEDVWGPLVRPLGYDPGVRGLDRLITNMCRKSAMLIVSGQAEAVRITNDNVKEFLPIW